MSRLDKRRKFELAHWAIENLHNPKAVQPEDWPDACRLRTNGVLPIFSGDYAPGLTGLYAILNGLKLLVAEVAPLKPSEEQMLFEVGCNFMKGREAITPHRGIRSHMLIRVAEAMAFALVRRRGDWILSEPVRLLGPCPVGSHALLERTVLAKRVALVLLGRGHYSVLQGYTSASWLLFDATGRQWMLRRRNRQDAALRPILILSRGY